MSTQTKLDIGEKTPDSYRGVYSPTESRAFKISRSKIDLFMECRRCSYLELRIGIKRPSGPPFTLNNAVDELFKKEFDTHRASANVHPLCEAYGVDAVPFAHDDIEKWRDARYRGIDYYHQNTNFLVHGGIDDVWVDPKGELIIVDYKATAKRVGPSTEDDLYDAYKRQIEIYQWLFKQNGFKVSETGYFVYANGLTDRKAFDGKLDFDVKLIGYKGSTDWIEPALHELKTMLDSDKLPGVGKSFGGGPCEYCTYSKQRTEMTLNSMRK